MVNKKDFTFDKGRLEIDKTEIFFFFFEQLGRSLLDKE